jgi:hypothetical protein
MHYLASFKFLWKLRCYSIRGHSGALAKPQMSGVYDSSRVKYLSCAWGSCISSSVGVIHRGMHGVLRAMIWCDVTSICPLAAVVLWLGAASLDSFGDPAYSSLHDPVWVQHGDWAPHRLMELLLPCPAMAGLRRGSGSVTIFVRSGSRVNPSFCFLMSVPPVGWWKVWFFLKNDADVPLPIFMGSRPIPQPKWGYGVAQ